ncbi:NUDIX hydrolase [Sulfuracidifex tepidarius]|uniref:ADP-ribose pyrophosphatase n=1 Tax=Sulfuracidifex tepidarius TaxID=1294262 RepID=A0A510E671_9CREN|nr:NUDIX domain-containing protein [Sulfuracidifex tepidarius]BBG25215.1 ADP-ribose pyrophosphatase [Sulfuracidifex tepidarius]BBG28009.1 ADP-ribose pyrophosphatase [Sulfuracidifex tepidarius]
MVKKCIVAGGILIEDDKVLLIKHKKLGKWLYPGGHVEENETPHEAAEREFLEETGLRVNVIGDKFETNDPLVSPEPLPITISMETVNYPDVTHLHYDMIFLVKRIGGELSEGKWFSYQEIDQLDTYENVRQILKMAFDRKKGI